MCTRCPRSAISPTGASSISRSTSWRVAATSATPCSPPRTVRCAPSSTPKMSPFRAAAPPRTSSRTSCCCRSRVPPGPQSPDPFSRHRGLGHLALRFGPHGDVHQHRHRDAHGHSALRSAAGSAGEGAITGSANFSVLGAKRPRRHRAVIDSAVAWPAGTTPDTPTHGSRWSWFTRSRSARAPVPGLPAWRPAGGRATGHSPVSGRGPV